MNNKISLWIVLVAAPAALIIGLVAGWSVAASIAGSESRVAAERYALLEERYQALEEQQKDVLKLYEAAKQALEAVTGEPSDSLPGDTSTPNSAPGASAGESLSDMTELLDSYNETLKQLSELANAFG